MTAFDQHRLRVLQEAVQRDLDDDLYYGASIKISRHGETVFDIALGHGDKDATIPLATDSIFSVFSTTKAFINVLILRAVELGRLSLTTRMVDLIPEFAGAPRDRATIFHFLTHTTGMQVVWEPRPDKYLDDLSIAVDEVCRFVPGIVEPGSRCDYSPMANHALLGEVLRRIDPGGRDIIDIMDQDLFIPLGMTDTAMGIRPHMRPRHIVPDERGIVPITHLSKTAPGPDGLFVAESNESTWVGSASTTGDLTRFANMLRDGGMLDGVRILSRRTVKTATTVWTGDLPNELYKTVALRAGYEVPPAYLGLGFNLRGEKIVHHQLGTLTSPGTFGNYGAGSVVYWIDPEVDMTFVALTAGLLPQAQNIDRFQRLSDIAVSSAI